MYASPIQDYSWGMGGFCPPWLPSAQFHFILPHIHSL